VTATTCTPHQSDAHEQQQHGQRDRDDQRWASTPVFTKPRNTGAASTVAVPTSMMGVGWNGTAGAQ